MKTLDWIMGNIQKIINARNIAIFINEDNRIYDAIITELPAIEKRVRRFEIEIPDGISINDFDECGDNLLYAWCFPANSENEAITEFIRRVREEREKNN
jgi:hypothetical protein